QEAASLFQLLSRFKVDAAASHSPRVVRSNGGTPAPAYSAPARQRPAFHGNAAVEMSDWEEF
ncbi:MAG: chemotaxis protein, partial [Hoeflea sp.]|nr:chemotaxis protein [Hoeflea sp.]